MLGCRCLVLTQCCCSLLGDKANTGENNQAIKDPEPHTGGGLNLTFIIIPVVAVVVITALVAIAVFFCRR